MTLTSLAQTWGLTAAGLIVLLLGLGLLVARTRTRWPPAALLALLVAVALVTSRRDAPPAPTPLLPGSRQAWQDAYISAAQAALPDYAAATANTAAYALDDPLIRDTAAQIAAHSTSAKDAMRKTLTYVYTHTTYVPNERDDICMERSAADVLRAASGQCDTQSLAVIALLRSMGVASVPAGGCVYQTGDCPLQALFPLDAPRVTPLSVLDPAATSWGRGVTGGLHAWAVAWDDDSRTWIDLEPTAGRFADTRCWTYHVELFPANTDKQRLCVTTNWAYAAACRSAAPALLDAWGLGVAGRVPVEAT